MEKVCPLCNALTAVAASCPVCGRPLADGGAVENYYGPYSPYMDVDSLPHCGSESQCVHLLYCPECGYDERKAWPLTEV